jgi:hypothetical protein
VTVCDRWRDSFQAFADDMGKRSSRAHSLDRIDGTRGYEPDNCRWATRKEQQRNRKVVKVIEHKGRAQSIARLAAEAEALARPRTESPAPEEETVDPLCGCGCGDSVEIGISAWKMALDRGLVWYAAGHGSKASDNEGVYAGAPRRSSGV